jgi:hypothetical protein
MNEFRQTGFIDTCNVFLDLKDKQLANGIIPSNSIVETILDTGEIKSVKWKIKNLNVIKTKNNKLWLSGSIAK